MHIVSLKIDAHFHHIIVTRISFLFYRIEITVQYFLRHEALNLLGFEKKCSETSFLEMIDRKLFRTLYLRNRKQNDNKAFFLIFNYFSLSFQIEEFNGIISLQNTHGYLRIYKELSKNNYIFEFYDLEIGAYNYLIILNINLNHLNNTE